jgi:LysR family glycine cleavage system transcriptional activator
VYKAHKMKRRPLPLQALRAFEAAGRLGRMTAAGDELCVTHGAVSRQVQHLEDVLGLALFSGPRTRPHLTEAGRALLPALTSALDQIESAVQAITRAEDDVLDVSCLSTLLMRLLIPRLHNFHSRHPGIDLRLRALEKQDDARSGRFDVAIIVDETRNLVSARQKADILFREWLGPVATPELASRNRVAPGDLPADRQLQTKTRPNGWATWSAAAGVSLAPPAGAVFEHYYYTLEAATAGLGYCIAPWHLVMGEIHSGRLVAPFGFVESGYSYLVERRQPSNTKIERFCTWLAGEVATMPAPQARLTPAGATES